MSPHTISAVLRTAYACRHPELGDGHVTGCVFCRQYCSTCDERIELKYEKEHERAHQRLPRSIETVISDLQKERESQPEPEPSLYPGPLTEEAEAEISTDPLKPVDGRDWDADADPSIPVTAAEPSTEEHSPTNT